ncbi:hypothetical protein PVK06_027770 [Gossypium arboreum]|uniref:Cytochrome c oxidase subunit 5C n=9 Tax=Gossypium TaxID=3633 RepID=A0ABR0P162_GOSAR|nr:hypothetical protein PVK06_027770 [Gossypium arboreum]
MKVYERLLSLLLAYLKQNAGSRVAHATFKGPSIVNLFLNKLGDWKSVVLTAIELNQENELNEGVDLLHWQIVKVLRFNYRSEMAGSRVAHATLKGPSVVKEIVIGITLGLCAGGLWKMHHWNEQRKVRAFYDMLEKGEISVIAEE